MNNWKSSVELIDGYHTVFQLIESERPTNEQNNGNPTLQISSYVTSDDRETIKLEHNPLIYYGQVMLC